MKIDLEKMGKPEIAVAGFSAGLVFALLCIGSPLALLFAAGLAVAAALGVLAHLRFDPREDDGKEGQQ